jgi:hypothetical protein
VLITLTAKIFSGSHTKESRARMRNKPNNPPLETTQAPSAPPIFDPRKGVELTDAFGQLKRIVGPRDVGNKHTVKYFNRKVHAGELELILVRPDGTYRRFNDAAERQKLNVRAPLNFKEGCSVELYIEEGRWYVRRSDLDRLTTIPSPAARAEESRPGPAPAVEPPPPAEPEQPTPAPSFPQVEPEPPPEPEPVPAVLPVVNPGGRPTDRDLVREEARWRLEHRQTQAKSLAAFARELRKWLKDHGEHRAKKTGEVMKADTIGRHVRPLWKGHR